MNVFEKYNLNGIEINNRIIRSATHDGLADSNGAPTEKLIKKYETLAKNNVGCIITGYAAVSKEGRSNYPGMLFIDSDDNLSEYKELVDRVHSYNTPIVLQIAHCGRQTSSKKIGYKKMAPSPLRHLFYWDKAQEFTKEDIDRLIDDFVQAAQRAKKVGFDGVQLHCGHGYLLHDFLSANGNRRKDEYGGSLVNRTKVVSEIIRRIKTEVDIPVWIKISAVDNRKNGMRLDSTIEILQILEQSGLDVVEVSCGSVQDGMNTMRSRRLPMEAVFEYRDPCAKWPKWFSKFCLFFANLINPLIPQPKPLENFNVDNAKAIKDSLSIPTIVVGGIHKLKDIQTIIETNQADCVSMCRPFICEPNLVAKFQEGLQDQAKCIMCNYCGLVIEKEPTRCLYGKIKNK